MALPIQPDILTGKFSVDGSPWVKIVKDGINNDLQSYSVDGSPWNGISDTGIVVKEINAAFSEDEDAVILARLWTLIQASFSEDEVATISARLCTLIQASFSEDEVATISARLLILIQAVFTEDENMRHLLIEYIEGKTRFSFAIKGRTKFVK